MQVRNRITATMLSCGIALGAGVALAGEPPASASDCFVAGVNAGDADAVAACYAEDAILWFPGGPMVKGRAAIRDGFADYFDNATVKDVELTPMGQEAMGDTKVSWGNYAIRMVDNATQAESVDRGRYTDVQKKIDGRWLYIVDHPSNEPAPAEE